MKLRDWILAVILVYSSVSLANAVNNTFFFNRTSVLQISSGTIPLNKRFDFTFRTCYGGILLYQSGSGSDYILFEVSQGKVNYTISVKPPHFTPSQLSVKWKVGGVENAVTVGKELDKNHHFKVRFVPGSGSINTTISLEGPKSYTAEVPSSIHSFVGGGPLYVGGSFVNISNVGEWFSGCIENGNNIVLSIGNPRPANPPEVGCPLDSQIGCPNRKACAAGFTGDYCEINIDDCSGQCHSYSHCNDGINNYTCECGPRWTGRHCDQFLGSLCEAKPCQNGGICQDTVDKNNYTCTCDKGYTGWNCNGTLHPCETLNCLNGATCQKRNNVSDDHDCVCPTGFNGIRCEQNINDCAKEPCKPGRCIDAVNNYTCNCTGSGYEGVECKDDINECQAVPGPCLNGGSCTNYLGTYGCRCLDGYRGKNCEENIDECTPNPCKNGGICRDGVNDYNCTCVAGYNGTTCENNIDECVHHTCNKYQSCVDQVNGFICVCKPGYTGPNCTVDIKECISNPCRHGGTCLDGVNSYTCICLSRFNGTYCEFDNFDDCLSNPCANNGTCQDDVGFFNCTCPKGYVGERCENKSDSCHPNPCENAGACAIVNNTDFNCTCAIGFTGKNCSKNIDDCAHSPCVQNATCVDMVNNYTCQCPLGYHGDYCEIDINECQSNPCRNNATCENELGRFTCKCLSGFNGTMCENNIDDCPAHGCFNGTCQDGINNYTCVCYPGFEGDHCERDIDECQRSVCQNSATCVNSPGSYQCQCNQFTNGTNCELDINECKQNLCKNGAKCDNYINTGFECFCRSGFFGTHCEYQVDECTQPQHGGKCKHFTSCVDKVDDFLCICKPGWKGKYCDVDIDECQLGYCQNGATCYNGLDAYYNCTCVPGYTDHNCSTDIDECATQPCANGATCNDYINYFNCTCAPGFTGFNCSEEINECESNPCENNATCTDLINDFNCSCAANYTGSLCQYRKSLCRPNNPCYNNGTCLDLGQENFTCNCAPGFGGKLCENITTIGLNGSSYMAFGVGGTAFSLSLQFRTTLKDGALAIDSNEKLLLQLKGGRLEISNGATSATLGNKLSDGVWHEVVVNITSNSLEVYIGNYSCAQCIASVPRTLTTIPKLFIGGSTGNLLGSSNLIGCIQNVMVDGVMIIPSQPGVERVNLVSGCPRVQVCHPNPCTHGTCVDQWIKYTCECDRRWTGSICNTGIVAGTFGAQAPLKSVARRVGRDVSTIKNSSYAKFATDTSITMATELSFFVRTRQNTGLVAFLTDTSSNHVTVGVDNGEVFVQLTNGNSRRTRNLSTKINDGAWHFVSVSNNQSTVDNDTYQGIDVQASFNVKLTFLGGLEDWNAYSDAIIVKKIPLRGCIQDVRLNNKLLPFSPVASPVGSFSLISTSHLGRGCPGEDVCAVAPCGAGGTCDDRWNKYECQCRPRYGGPDCSLYGCALTHPCPSDSVCSDVNGQYECIYPVTLNASLSDARFTLAAGVTLKPLISLTLRTRQRHAVVLQSRSGGDELNVTLETGQIMITYSFGVNIGSIKGDAHVNDGTWHNVSLNATTTLQLTIDGSTSQTAGNFTGSQLETLIRSDPIRTGLGVSMPYKGCLDNVRVGGDLLPFIPYYNATYNVSHVTSLKPRFEATTLSGIPKGCSSDDACGVKPCKRGQCSDIWNAFHCACPEGYAGPTCNLTANMTCAHAPCMNNAACTNETAANLTQISDVGVDNFICNCTPGYVGRLCNQTTDECASSPCTNGGSCTDLHLNYRCACVNGFTGRNCEINIDDCVNNNCTNNATCVDLVADYNCSCAQGFNGTYCELDINECLTNPCSSYGTKSCNNTIGSYKCFCNQGYYGNHCQYNATQWCEVGRPCNNGNCSANATGFYCACSAGWSGRLCSEDVRECDSTPCRNNGTCIDSHAVALQQFFPGYRCNCTVDYSGNTCDKLVTPCDANPCRNGSCIRLAYDQYQCNCTEGFGNVNCSGLVRFCTPSPCEHGSTCVPLMDSYRCECAPGYMGPNCGVLINKCDSNPCQNNGSCTSENGGYSCACPDNFVGKHCETDNPCTTNPCKHEGQCLMHPVHLNYTCNCTANYEGLQCESEKEVVPPVAGKRTDDQEIGLIIGVVAAGVLVILLVLLLVLIRKRAGNGTYSPSKEEFGGGRVELNSMMKPPNEERLI